MADSGDPWFASVSMDVTKVNGFTLASRRAPATQRGKGKKGNKREKEKEEGHRVFGGARVCCETRLSGYHHFRLHPIPLGCFSL